jgi:hypothetical protein
MPYDVGVVFWWMVALPWYGQLLPRGYMARGGCEVDRISAVSNRPQARVREGLSLARLAGPAESGQPSGRV